MEVLIKRHFSCSEYVIVRCYVDDTYLCDTLEPSVSGVKHSCIPVGCNSFKGHLTQSSLAYCDLLDCMTKSVLYSDKIIVGMSNV